jgi:hypothetical protein
MGKRVVKKKPDRAQAKKSVEELIQKLRQMDQYFEGVSQLFEEQDARIHVLEERLGIKNEAGETIENRKEEGQEGGATGGVETDGAGREKEGDRKEVGGGSPAVAGEEGTTGTSSGGGICRGEIPPGC